MNDIAREPATIRADDINPRYNWGRHLPVLGSMGVDFEERVDYRRMHRYRRPRARDRLDRLRFWDIHPPRMGDRAGGLA